MKRSTLFKTTLPSQTSRVIASCLIASCALMAAGCGSKSKGGGGGGSDFPGGDFGDSDFPVTNTASEKEFFAKAGEAKTMAGKVDSPLEKFSRTNRINDNEIDPSETEGLSLKSANTLEQQSQNNFESTFTLLDNWVARTSRQSLPSGSGSINPGESSSATGQQDLTINTDYGQGFQSLDNCADAIKEIRSTYKQTLSALEQQFKMIEQLDSSDASEAGFKRVQKDNAAIAYTFEGDSGEGMVKGRIEGAADASNIKILMALEQQMKLEGQSDSSQFPDGEMEFLSAAPQKNSQNVTMKMSVGSLANLKEESIKTRMKLSIVSNTEGPLVAMALNAQVNGGTTPGLMQEIEMTTPGKDKKPQAFNMQINAQVKSEKELVLALKSSGIAMDEGSVPALDLSYTLQVDSKGSCAVRSPSKK